MYNSNYSPHSTQDPLLTFPIANPSLVAAQEPQPYSFILIQIPNHITLLTNQFSYAKQPLNHCMFFCSKPKH